MSVRTVAIRIIPKGCCIGVVISLSNGNAVSIHSGAQVLPHPALVANFYGVIDIAVSVGEGERTHTR